MRTRVLGLIAGIVLALSVGIVAAQPEEYQGASFCREVKAWPYGTYLGQMHPYHVEHYVRFAGEQACTRWAADQQASAVNGLRALGYTVVAPSRPVARPPQPQPPAPVATPSATTRTGWIDPSLQPVWDMYASALREAFANRDAETRALAETFVSGPRADAVRIVWARLPDQRAGQYVRAAHTIQVSERLQQESFAVQAAILAPEMVHAVAVPTANREQCFGWERIAFGMQVATWLWHGYPSVATPMERWLTKLVDIIDTPAFDAWVEEAYTHQCAELRVTAEAPPNRRGFC